LITPFHFHYAITPFHAYAAATLITILLTLTLLRYDYIDCRDGFFCLAIDYAASYIDIIDIDIHYATFDYAISSIVFHCHYAVDYAIISMPPLSFNDAAIDISPLR